MAYFANGTEGDVLEEQCSTCPLGEKGCPIIHVQMMYNYDQIGIPKLREAMNMLVDEKGKCQLRPLVVDMKPEKDILQYLEETK